MSIRYEMVRTSKFPKAGSVMHAKTGADLVRDFAIKGVEPASTVHILNRLIDLIGRLADESNINLLSVIRPAELTGTYIVLPPKE
jgi:hypothetical protein